MRNPTRRGRKPSLTLKMQTFADEFLANGGHAAKAARAAGYGFNTARTIGKIRWHPEVVKYINARAKVYNNKKAQLKATEVIEQLASVVRSNLSDFVEEDLHGGVRLKPFCMLDKNKLNAVSEINIETTGTEDNPVTRIKLKFWDKNAAANTLCRHFGLFNEGDEGGSTDRQVVFNRALSVVDNIIERIVDGREGQLAPRPLPDRPLFPVEVYTPKT